MQKIAWSTFGVLAACVVALIALKRMGFKGVMSRNTTAGSGEIVDSLTVAPKCDLHLVNLRGMKLVVAMDPAGIKAMVPFASFREELQQRQWSDRDEEIERRRQRFSETGVL